MQQSVSNVKARNYFPVGGLPLKVQVEPCHNDRPLHAHDFTELIIVTGGSGRHCLGRHAYPVMAGDVFVISPGVRHGYAQTRELALVNILFRPAQLSLPHSELLNLPGYHALIHLEPRYRQRHNFQSRLRLGMPILTHIRAQAVAIRQELAQRRPGCELIAVAILTQLLCELARAYEGGQTPDSQSLLRVAGGIHYIEHHYTEPITLTLLARITHQSPRALTARFKAATGLAPIAYLINYRIRRACELLREGHLNITETAMQVGFADSNYFTRQFRKVMEMTPRQFQVRGR